MRLFYYSPILFFVFHSFKLKSQNDTAQQVIDKTINLYQQCGSYQDEGIVVMRVRTGNNIGIFKRNFATQFGRANRNFSFQTRWKNQSNNWECYAIIGNDREGWQAISTQKNYRKRFETLLQGLIVASEISQSVAYKVPSLLLSQAEPAHWNIQSVKDWQLATTVAVVIDNQNTWHLKGTLPEADVKQIEVFIDQNTHLIKRLLFATNNAITVLDYKPKINLDTNEILLIDEQNYCIEK